MSSGVCAALFVLATWWLSTALVLRRVWLARSTFQRSARVAAGLALGGAGGLLWSSRVESATAAYVGFVSALAVWGFHELTFLLGMVTGPRKTDCPPGARGWTRFVCATSVVIHHEVALAVTMLAMAALTWGAPNQVGTQTFLVLWIMRLSAKLNVFLGVRNLTEQFVPEHLRYLRTYFRRAWMNPLMPVSVLAASFVVFRLGVVACSTDASAFEVVGHTLLATILGLAVLEHVFLAFPLPDAVLWRWATQTKRGALPHPAPTP